MESLVGEVLKHGYPILFAIVLLETLGFPIPAALALIVAGGAVANHYLNGWQVVACSVAALLTGDGLMFVLGRKTGWWLLGILCRLSLNPESCIFRSTAAFRKRGRALLVFAKFVPGINTIAAPLAGSMNMRPFAFLRYDFIGALLYTGAYFTIGVLSGNALTSILRGYRALNSALGWALLAGLIVYLVIHAWLWLRSKPLRYAPTVEPEVAAAELAADQAVAYDVRSHGYYDAKTVRIPGSRRIDPNTFTEWREDIPRDRHVYLYCTCVREATSARMALVMLEHAIPCLVIRGGLRRWRKLGLPVEPVPADELVELPIFG